MKGNMSPILRKFGAQFVTNLRNAPFANAPLLGISDAQSWSFTASLRWRNKVAESAQNTAFRRKPQIFADSPLILEIPAFEGRRFSQKTADFRRKPPIFAENRRKPQIGLCHLRSVTFSSALEFFGGPPRGGDNFTSLFKCSSPFDQSFKCTLSYFKSCIPVGGTPSSTSGS